MEIIFICAYIFSLFSLVNCTSKYWDCQFLMLAFLSVIMAAMFLIIQLVVYFLETSTGQKVLAKYLAQVKSGCLFKKLKLYRP